MPGLPCAPSDLCRPGTHAACGSALCLCGAPVRRAHGRTGTCGVENTIAGTLNHACLSLRCIDPGNGMAPAHIAVFLSQKPSSKNGIIMPAIFLSVAIKPTKQAMKPINLTF